LRGGLHGIHTSLLSCTHAMLYTLHIHYYIVYLKNAKKQYIEGLFVPSNGRASSSLQESWDERASGPGEARKHREEGRTPSPVSPTRRRRYHLTKNDTGEVTFAGTSQSANQRVERALSVDTGVEHEKSSCRAQHEHVSCSNPRKSIMILTATNGRAHESKHLRRERGMRGGSWGVIRWIPKDAKGTQRDETTW
jgi:hypothetical protein